MTKWGRKRGAPPGVEALGAFVVSAAFVALTSVVINEVDHVLSAVILATVCIAAILAAGNFWGVAFAVPLSLAGLIAFDWYYVEPTHVAGVPDAANSLQLALFLLVAVLIGQVASRARRRASGSEEARSALAEEQAALRRVATLVARGVAPDELFAAVAEEIGRVMRLDVANTFRFGGILRYGGDGTARVVATWGAQYLPISSIFPLDGDSIAARIARTSLAVRIDDYSEISSELAERTRGLGARSGVGAPIIVDGRLWGAALAFSTQSLAGAAEIEERIAKFTELIAIAIANAESRAELKASRARIVAAADRTRRQLERDLHDGIQQRLVSLALEVRSIETTPSANGRSFQTQLAKIGKGLTGVLDDLREISRGIHPAILIEGGLEPALRALARRSAVPVELAVCLDGELSERVEVAAYYVASEALANAAKHAHASAVELHVEPHHGALNLSISDDGVGGADPDRGSGLIGLRDRVEALGGTISVRSPAGDGTSLDVRLPLDGY
jgi:signal transduction histidine kinase